MSEIQDEAYSEALDEIERLKDEWHAEIERSKRYADGYEKIIAVRDAEIERFKGLLNCAADALTYETQKVKAQWEAIAEAQRLNLEQLRAQNNELKRLLACAVEALEFWMKDLASTEQQYVDAAIRDERLLSELRKAGGEELGKRAQTNEK